MRRCLMPLLGLALLAGCRGYESIEVDGTRRDFLLHVPEGAAPAEGRPLVIAFHGAYSTPDATEDYTGLSTLADAENFVVVYPKGKQRLWNDGRIPDAYDDVAFTAALIDHLIAGEDVDPDRVFVTGISNGGFMAHRIGCDLGDRVAAIAPVAGTLSQELLEVCEPAGPVAMMMFMGTDDDLVPYEGGELGGKLGAGIFGTMLSARDTAEQWAGFEGCVGEPALETLNAVALAGGAPKNMGMDAEKFFNSTNQQELLDAIQLILGEVTDCTIDLTMTDEGPPDPIQVP
ncbi:MAG: alpha/beta hydrolase fold domain-containing protein, partial [Myxococcales bacterium]|nr:alpha/beta hydrolase fold domain-containing protein [Myxococcales bacterium]